MTTEQDDKPRRRPPTIDLTATEIPAATSETPSAAAEPGATPSSGRAGSYATGALAGVVVGLLVAAGLWAAGLMPLRGNPAPPPGAPAVAAPSTEALDALAARLTKIETTLAAPRADPASAARMAAAEAETKSLADTVAAIAHRIDDAVAAAREARSRADAAQSSAADAEQKAARAGQGTVQRGDLDALTGRIAALERSVKTLTEELGKRTTAAANRAARLVVATAAMRAAIEHGDSFAGELAAARALGAEQDSLTALAAYAASGVPSAASLSRELTALLPAMRQAAVGKSDKDSGLLDRLQANAQRLVRITPVDGAGDDPETVLTRIAAAAAHDDLAAAIAAIVKLPESSRALAAEWVKKAKMREALVTAARKIANDALAELAKAGAQ